MQKLDFIEPGGPVTSVRYGDRTSLWSTRSIPWTPPMNMSVDRLSHPTKRFQGWPS